MNDTKSYKWVDRISNKIIPNLISQLNLKDPIELNITCKKIISLNQFVIDINTIIKKKFIDICENLEFDFVTIENVDNRPYMWIDIVTKKIIPELLVFIEKTKAK